MRFTTKIRPWRFKPLTIRTDLTNSLFRAPPKWSICFYAPSVWCQEDVRLFVYIKYRSDQWMGGSAWTPPKTFSFFPVLHLSPSLRKRKKWLWLTGEINEHNDWCFLIWRTGSLSSWWPSCSLPLTWFRHSIGSFPFKTRQSCTHTPSTKQFRRGAWW